LRNTVVVCVLMTRKDWDEAVQEQVARAVKTARGSRSAQEIADETARLGYPISRSQIANLESGRKQGIDVAELLILAAALRVPPVALLFPDLPDGEIEALPGVVESSAAALFRFTGERDRGAASDFGMLLKFTREREAARTELERALAAAKLLAADEKPTGGKRGGMSEQQVAEQIAAKLNALSGLSDRINELDSRLAVIRTGLPSKKTPKVVVLGGGGEGSE